MYFKVEIQRDNGRKLAGDDRRVLHGQLVTGVRQFGIRTYVFLQVNHPRWTPGRPHLFNPVLVEATHEGLRFSGLDLTEDGGWVAQTWWCMFMASDAMDAELVRMKSRNRVEPPRGSM